MRDIEFRFYTVDNSISLSHLLTQSSRIVQWSGSDDILWKFDFSRVKTLNAAGIAVYALLARLLREQQVKFVMVVESANSNLHESIIGTGLAGADIMIKKRSVDASWGSFVFSDFEKADDEIIQTIAERLMPLFSGVPNIVEGIEETLGELMDNVYAHSNSTVGGVVVARHVADRALLELVVGDLGVGITNHLRQNVSDLASLSDEEVMTEAFKLGVSGDRKTRFGSGLPFVRDTTMKLGGTLEAYSHITIYRFADGKESMPLLGASFPGTLISLTWPTK